jgi:hypothetical protein
LLPKREYMHVSCFFVELGLLVGRGKRVKQEVDYSIFLDDRLPVSDDKLEEQMHKESEYRESIQRSRDTSAYVSLRAATS